MQRQSRKESEMGHVYQIEYEVVEVYEKGEKCFMRLRWKQDGKDREIVFPIAHGTFDLIKKKFGNTKTHRAPDSVTS
jgi:hypothetical protein